MPMLMTADAHALALRAKLFRGFSDPSRLAIILALEGRARSVSEVVQATGLSQSNVSNHLGCLHDCALVSRKQLGRYVYYRLSDERVLTLLRVASDLLADVARGIYECTHYDGPLPNGAGRE